MVGVNRPAISALGAALLCAVWGPAPARGAPPAEPAETPRRAPERWAVEVGAHLGRAGEDAYQRRLRDFGFRWRGGAVIGPEVAVSRAWSERWGLLLHWTQLETALFTRTNRVGVAERQDDLTWSTHALGLHARALLPLCAGRVRLYAQAGGGVAVGTTAFATGLDDRGRRGDGTESHRRWHAGLQGGGAGGIQVMGQRLGFLAQLRYLYAAPVVNQLGDRRQSGGLDVLVGLRMKLGGAP
jgi:hypothetical protein